KVTGSARYAAEFPAAHLAHAVIVESTIASGRIRKIDTAAAEAAPGVLAVISYRNAPRLHPQQAFPASAVGQTRIPLQDDSVQYNGEQVAVVVAETLQQAQEGATLVRVTYEETAARVDLAGELPKAFSPSHIFGRSPSYRRGDPEAALAAAAV